MGGGIRPPPEVYLTWKPNYVNPERRGPSLVVLEVVLLALCYVVVGLRVWTRVFHSKNFGLDDATIVVNIIPLTGLAACPLLGYMRYGWDKHVWDNTVPVLIAGRKVCSPALPGHHTKADLFELTLAYEVLYLLSTGMTKISVLLFYRRLASGALSKGFRYTIYAAMASVIMATIAFIVTSLTICSPLNAMWNEINPLWRISNKGKYHCVNESAVLIASAAIGMVQDFIACTMPMVLFWKLQISRGKKIALVAIFSTGLLLCVCAILRVVFLVHLYYYTYDLTWEDLNVWYTTILESHLAIVCASAPALYHFTKYTWKNSILGIHLRSFVRFNNDSRPQIDSEHMLDARQRPHDEPRIVPAFHAVQPEDYSFRMSNAAPEKHRQGKSWLDNDPEAVYSPYAPRSSQDLYQTGKSM